MFVCFFPAVVVSAGERASENSSQLPVILGSLTGVLLFAGAGVASVFGVYKYR